MSQIDHRDEHSSPDDDEDEDHLDDDDIHPEELTPEELADVASPYHAPATEALLDRAIEIIDAAKPMPLSSNHLIDRDELLDILEDAIDKLPDELRAARWLLKERDEYLAKVRREGDEILEAARGRAEHMVQRTEVVKAAEQRARQIIEAADAEARRMRHETEDYCDQKLASFEIVLHRTLKMVSAGREKLQAMPGSRGEIPEEVDADLAILEGPDVFDQDFG